jgi:hypothetical protein
VKEATGSLAAAGEAATRSTASAVAREVGRFMPPTVPEETLVAHQATPGSDAVRVP